MTDTNWITQTFKKKFVIENGQVKLRPPRAAAAPPEAPASLGGPKMLRGVKSAPVAALMAPAPFKLVKGGGRKAVEMLRQASAPAPAPPAPVAPTAPAAKPKKDKFFFMGLSAMYPRR